ncbi:lysophospholipid acyltransferase family protein [Antrihabitans stalactiti]|uniref:1-acyl-sn-glycerol-3-phosphate acyltransferase n=1 Tax=Antrihabitans stalactiti TaxID=2584121 RepID=A0A848KMH7_9NOCA|nr:lysophospholipid acyltransferase family protein [Antrihabitans stalactiti]NMN99439.1 1-acyl-sn-glycerol-3-phosphate acyltransferase [Antrihabitans stalactiti]
MTDKGTDKGKKPRGLGKRAWLTTHAVRRLARFLAFIKVVDITVVNRGAVPKKGPVIVACNHISYTDPVFLWGALRRRAIAIGMAELWTMPVVGRLVKLLGHIPVVRGDALSGADAVERATAVVSRGGVLIIFPEGKIVGRGETAPYRPGAARIALATGAPIVPAGIVGSNDVMPLKRDRPGKKTFYRDRKVVLVFGHPIQPEPGMTEDDLIDLVRLRISELTA